MSTAPKLHNKSSKPNNIVLKENLIIEKCKSIEETLPSFMRDYFIFLKNSVSLSSRNAYLEDIQFYLRYLISHEENFNMYSSIKDIQLSSFDKIRARDLNYYIGEYCSRYDKDINGQNYIFQNHNKSLARKRSSLTSLFKFLYRNEQLSHNITDGLNPIKLPKKQPDAVKKLDMDEVYDLIDIVNTGKGFTEKELIYWEKTKFRDKTIIMFFVTYGLRLSELQQLNISSFNFSRNEFKIYRKRDKESIMPLNITTKEALIEYIENERPSKEKLNEENQDALFLSLQYTRLTTKSIRDLIKKYTSIAMKTSRREGYSPHKLRATAASALIDQEFSIYEVKNLLDHDDVTTTQLYSAHKKNSKKNIIDRFEWNEIKKENEEK